MKLAEIVKILSVDPIAGADSIETASVLGYNVVVRKGSFKAGDLAAFIYPDTTIPRKPWSEFLFKGDHASDTRIRLKVAKLRGQVSQGLLVSLKDVPQCIPLEGDNVTVNLEIEKFEKPLPACLAGDSDGYLPSFVHKTDEDNLRSNIAALKELEGREVYITQKIDGSSGTFLVKDGDFKVCSRNLVLKKTDRFNTFWHMAELFRIEQILRASNRNLCLQGEVYGHGIQGNPLGVQAATFGAFDLYDIDKAEYFGLDDFLSFCFINNLPTVKIVYRGLFRFDLETLIEMANEEKYVNGQPCEGIVIRPVVPVHSNVTGRRLSVKVISEKYALKHGE